MERLPGSRSIPPNPLQSLTLPRGSKSLPVVGDSPEESIMKLEASLPAILRKERRGVSPKAWIDSNSWRPRHALIVLSLTVLCVGWHGIHGRIFQP